jgi:GTP-binding protein
MFVDQIIVRARGGDGGKGCISFRREKYIPRGGPNGGDGGHGGSVIFAASEHEDNLNALYFLNHYEGERGEHGLGKDCHGRNGADVVVKVPVGTLVKDVARGNLLVADLDRAGAEYLAARGGQGGRGNAHFVTSTNRAPRTAEPGREGEAREYELELKSIADVGLVGYPNAGKSSLINAVAPHVAQKTAPYPFTTRAPHVGVIEFPDFFRLTMADIPGLVEGAHRNVGLGHAFLRHIERTRVLVYVLDLAGTDGREPWADLKNLQRELELHLPGLSQRAACIAANKMDEPAAAPNLKRLRRRTKLPIFPVCAVLGEGCPALLDHLRAAVEPQRPPAAD